MLDFLGDAGGVYESIFLFGSFLSFLVSLDALSVKLIDGFFRVA